MSIWKNHSLAKEKSICFAEEILSMNEYSRVIKPNTIRLSIGIEKAEDVIVALEVAFEAVKFRVS